MSDVVKNPNRDRPRPVEIRRPEYERLGVNPTPFIPGNYGPVSSPKRPASITEVENSSFDTVETIMPPRKGTHIIDNNEFLSFGFPDGQIEQAVENGDDIDLDSELEIEDKSSAPSVGEYILMLYNDVITSGSLETIEEKIKGILYGEDIDFEFVQVSLEDLVVLKRVDIKVGVFIKD